jgi:hypothetical protein
MGNPRQHTASHHRLLAYYTPRVCVAFLRFMTVVWVLSALASPAYAATCKWTGKGANNRWSNKDNWIGCNNAAPKNNDDLEFSGDALQSISNNDIAGLNIITLVIIDAGALNARYDIGGLGFTVSGGIRALAQRDAAGLSPIVRANVVMLGTGFNIGPDTVLTMAGAITNPDTKAYIAKTGAGTLALSNPGNAWFIFEANEGVLSLGGAGALPDNSELYLKGSVTFDLNDISETIGTLTGTVDARIRLGAATLTVNQAIDRDFAGSISGTGGFVKNGPAMLSFSAVPGTASNNTYTGLTTVNEGTLELSKGDDTTAIAGPLLVNTDGLVRTMGVEQIADTARVTVAGRGTLDISKYYEHIGSLAGTGNIIIGYGRLIVGSDGTSTTFAGQLNADRLVPEDGNQLAVRFVKIGGGDLVMSGNSQIGGIAAVDAGRLIVDGRIDGTDVLVRGGTLSGTGTVFDGGVVKIKGVGDHTLRLTNGALAPGHTTPGILHADVADLRGGELRILLRGPALGTGYSQLDLATGLLLDGSTRLVIDRGDFWPKMGAQFTVVNVSSANAVQNLFADLPEGGTLNVEGLRFSITYKGGAGANDVVLTMMDDPPAITYFLSEGATGSFFDEDVLIANPGDEPAPVTLTFSKENGEQIVTTRTVPALSRATIRVDNIPGLEATVSSARVRSDRGSPLLVERSMFWNADNHSGHTGSAVDQPSRQWFFAEGSQGFFDTFLLVINPNDAPTDVTFTYLLENEPPVKKTVSLGASTRFTVHTGQFQELVNKSFGISIESREPIMAERAMYFGSTPSRFWSGGHESAGVTRASTNWFLAEGATGAFFDTFVLLSNPQSTRAQVTVRYLLDTGETVTMTKSIAANARLTINIEAEDDERLRNAAVSTVITSDVPIIAERSMYWLGAAQPWGEGHNSFGVVSADTRWGLAEGRVGGPLAFHTFILLANPADQAANVTVTFMRENGAPIVKTYTVPATSRFNIDSATVEGLKDETFGALITVTNGVGIIVERSMYWDQGDVPFSGGANATGIPLSEKK